VRVTHPGKLYFSRQARVTKLELVRYYLAVADGALGDISGRPIVLKRFVDGAAGLAWIVNLGCIELHPHAVRATDLDHPDELRVDLDPTPGVAWSAVRGVALEA